MGDRFYQQKCDYFNVSPTELVYSERYPDKPEGKKILNKINRKAEKGTSKEKAPKKETKADLILTIFAQLGFDELKFKGLEAMTMDNLKMFSTAIALMTEADYENLKEINIPAEKNRTKKPWIRCLQNIFATDTDFSKLTIATQKKVIEIMGL